MIYFITQDNEYVKIGKTTNNPESRLNELQTGNPVELKLWVSIPGDIEEERYLHSVFG